ncbi:family 3 encapsulin nanocompartment shell protein [Allonocardiopsis opalescens]|uniref:HK97 family phage major capsid protein n=1 Tax=Allonocardiopsis opalescens TaxID=1144618 RepID=A0A2T0QF26_9ACTN|nr:family 3 encapsulin nanocompartment shell protein [Allonocardiopsis opalescens]PRY02512.1 HK97 family phage major capsid protein [Allonocardiopsis opalescens]
MVSPSPARTPAAAPPADSPAASPGAAFARAFAAEGTGAAVRFDFTITDAFQPTKDRPRVTVRNLFRKRPAGAGPVRFWTEDRPGAAEAATVRESALRPEAAFRSGTAEADVHPISAWVQLPEELLEDPEGLAAFIDFRLLVRLATAENQALTIGEHGLLTHPGIATLPYQGDYLAGLMTACNEIEQIGATAHAMIVNPQDYYFRMVGTGLLADLARNGTLISRTRMVEPGCALVGDFAMAARLLDGGRSVIRVAEPPPGTFARPGVAVCAEIHEGLAVHLPTHFFHVRPTADAGTGRRA